MPEIDSLEIKIVESTSGAEKSLDALIGKLERLKQSMSGFSSSSSWVGQISRGLNKIAEASNSLDSSAHRKLERLSSSLGVLRNLKDVRINGSLPGQIERLSDSLGSITDDHISRAERLANALPGLSGLNLSGINLRGLSERSSAGGSGSAGASASSVSNLSDAVAGLNAELSRSSDSNVKDIVVREDIDDAVQRVNRLASALSGLKSFAVSVGGVALKGLGAHLKKPFIDGANAVKNFAGKISSLASAFGRIIMYRAIRTIIKEVTDAFRVGVNNLYHWSNALGGDFASSMDRAASSMLYFKNSIGAAVAPIINAFIPVLDVLVNAVVRVIEKFNQLFALFTGASYWTRAKKGVTEYATATAGAGKAMKALRDYTLGIDELTIFNDNKGSGGGFGGSATPDYSSMFENVGEFDPKLFDFAEKIKKYISDGDWVGLGSFVAGKVNSIFEPEAWGNAGEKIGSWIGNAVDVLYGFASTIDFRRIGNAVAPGFSRALTQINFSNLGKVYAKKVTMIPSMIIGAIEGMDWGAVGKSLSDFLVGATDGLLDFVYSVDWGKLADDFGSAFLNLRASIDWGALLHNAIEIPFALAFASIDFVAWLTESAFDSLWTWLQDTFAEGGKWTVDGIFNGIVSGLSSIGSWVMQNVFVPVWDAFCGVFGIHSPSKEMEKLGVFLIEGLLVGVESLVGDVESLFSGLWRGITVIFSGAPEWFRGSIINPISGFFRDLWGNASSYASSSWANIKGAFSSAGSWFSSSVIAPVSEFFTTLWSKLKNGAKTAWDGIKAVFSAAGTFFGDVFSAGWKKVVSVFQTGGQIFADIKDAVITAFKSIVNSLIRGINSVMAVPFEKLNGVIDSLRDVSILGATPFSGLSRISVPKIPLLASGGVVSSGQLFIARENGMPEMVGQFGGQTGVANNGQIEEGIAKATERGNQNLISSLYEIASRIITAIESNQTVVAIGDEQVGRANARYSARSGTNGSIGGFANEW